MLLLASASPARRRLLEQAAIAHSVQVSGVDEGSIHHPDPTALVRLLASAKAEAVAERALAQSTDASMDAVLGCDSLLVFEGKVFGKPATAAEATRRWRLMAGGWAELHTGHCLISPDECCSTTVTTRLQFAAINAEEIDTYVASGEPLQCAGGFALEGRGGLLVERIEGCYSNVIGLSLPLLRRWLTGPIGRQSVGPG